MKRILIVAIANNNAIGKNNRLLWRLPEDMKFFREQTMGHPVITGRKNYESIPEKFRPLPGRENAIITRNENYIAPGAKVFQSIESCFSFLSSDDKVFIIGGGQIYKEALEHNRVDEMLITHVHADFEADVFFPVINQKDWEIEVLLSKEVDEKHPFPFTIKKYTKKINR